MTIAVLGIGWVTREAYGSVRSGQQWSFAAGEDLSSPSRKGLFTHPFKNFGRMDAVSKTTACAVALALLDAGIEYGPDRKQDIGIIGTGREGSLRTDRDYFRDYIEGGRTLSRGNLFIYTLPSSPLGESAIHFGLQGPLLYGVTAPYALHPVMEQAASMIAGGEAAMMLAGQSEENESLFFALGREGKGPSFCSLTEALLTTGSAATVSAILRKFSDRKQER